MEIVALGNIVDADKVLAEGNFFRCLMHERMDIFV